GQCVVSACEDGTLKIWNIATGDLIATLERHTQGVTSCAVTPDARRVVSASEDRTLKVWDLATGECIITHLGDARFTAVAATATTICAGDETGTLWFLDWPPSLLPQPGSKPPSEPRRERR